MEMKVIVYHKRPDGTYINDSEVRYEGEEAVEIINSLEQSLKQKLLNDGIVEYMLPEEDWIDDIETVEVIKIEKED